MPPGPQHPIRWSARMIGRGLDSQPLRQAIAIQPGGFLLESAAAHPKYGRYSIYGVGRPIPDFDTDPFEMLANCISTARDPSISAPVPFVGGWIGFLSYECGQFVEPFERRHRGMLGPAAPGLAKLWSCDAALLHDHASDEWWAVACELPRHPSPSNLDEKITQLTTCALQHSPREPAPAAPAASPGVLASNMTRNQYLHAVQRAIEYIRAGDIFQVNFAQRFSAAYSDRPWPLYEQLCRSNPAMFAAYLAWDYDHRGIARSAILSSSPELFLDLRGRHVATRPIKGTRPRTGDERLDAAARRELEASEKDAAELLMIVDLERNDLGRVCEFGSVRVTSAAQTESHPTVFHRVATVEGRLRDGIGPVELLRATFPGGSITGAPKIRAMQIIDELEPDPRGPYCGAIGYIGIDGAMTLNLAIRTMCITKGQVHFWAGGGIVADSDAQAEYDETLAKAEGMRRALMLNLRETRQPR